jgi:hypothetical protein
LHFCSPLKLVKLGKYIPVTGFGCPQSCETSRIPHFLDSRFIHGGEVVSLTRWPPFPPAGGFRALISVKAESAQGHSAAGRMGQIEKSVDLIENRTLDLPACIIVPRPTTLTPFPTFRRVALAVTAAQRSCPGVYSSAGL